MSRLAVDKRQDLRVCTVCGGVCARFDRGPGGIRQDACCRTCGALERHRFLVLVASGLAAITKYSGLVLDVAPMRATAELLKASAQAGYLAIDFDPAADNRMVDVIASLTDVPVADDSVSLLVCMHVLEHIPDDAAAMREIARVLVPAGVAVIQVPHRAGVATDEDPSANADERLRRFGQADHVRYYGDDFEDRLQRAGLSVSILTPSDLVDPSAMALMGLLPDEKFWLCTPFKAGTIDPTALLREALPVAFSQVLSRSASATLREQDDAAKARLHPRQPPVSSPRNSGGGAPATLKRIRKSPSYRVLRQSLPGRAAAKVARSLRH